MKERKNLASFDIYSKRIGFFYMGHQKIGSPFGLFLTIIYVGASIVLFIMQIIRAIDRNELRVYDKTIYAQEMPIIDVDINQLYFAFALEDPQTSNRFIDESIYYAKVAFIDKVKKNDEFETVNTTYLDIEPCKVENFGKNYQHLFMQDELTNAYCLKDFNYNFPFAGGYKYERLTYIRLRIYPCNNSTTNTTCKPQEVIDKYLTSGYFSIVIKDFGLNPSNYTFPVLPTFQDLYTTIDKRIYRNYILNFGVTEIHTDTGLVNENLKVNKYLQYRNEIQTFSFRDEKDYYQGKSVILVQLRLDDTLIIQTRQYTKISDVFSRIGGYMQLMNTAFILISAVISKVDAQLKIVNSLFKFNLKDKKLILKLNSLHDANIIKYKKNVSMPSKIHLESLKNLDFDNKSKNNLILKENSIFNIPSPKKISNKDFNNFNNTGNQAITIKVNKSRINNIPLELSKIDSTIAPNEISKSRENSISPKRGIFHKSGMDIYNMEDNNLNYYTDFIHFNIFEYFFYGKCYKKNKYIDLYKKAYSFYVKKMDITHVFGLHSILEDFLIK